MSTLRQHAQLLKWDSELFGFPVYRITVLPARVSLLQEMLAQLRRDGAGLLYGNVPAVEEWGTAAVEAGGTPVGRRVTYLCRNMSLIDDRETASASGIVPFRGQVTAALESLAFSSGVWSRFNTDPRVPSAVFRALYRAWIDRSVNGEVAERVFVARASGTETGFVSVSTVAEHGSIALLAVQDSRRGKGIGRALVRAAIRHHLDMGRKSCQVITQQENQPACRLYENTGFSVEQIELVYHFWLR